MSVGDKNLPVHRVQTPPARSLSPSSLGFTLGLPFPAPAPSGGQGGLTGGCPGPGAVPRTRAPLQPPPLSSRCARRRLVRRWLGGPALARRRWGDVGTGQDPTAAPGRGGRRQRNSPQPSLASVSSVFVFVIPLFFLIVILVVVKGAGLTSRGDGRASGLH